MLLFVALTMAAGCSDDGNGGGRDAAANDASGPGWAHCPAGGSPPGWASADSPATDMVARCSDVDLHVMALPDGVARLVYVPSGQEPPTRSWAITEPPGPPPRVEVGSDGADAVICTEHWAVRVQETCRVQVVDRAGNVLLEDGDEGGWSTRPGQQDGRPVTLVSVDRATPASERFYGFGEKTGLLDKRGERLVFWNTDAYDPTFGGYAPDQDPLYQAIPFFVGLRQNVAYGVFTDNPHRLEMDLAAGDGERYTITAFGGAIDQYVIVGDRLPEVIRRYTALTGRPPLPPLWALGYHQCRWGYAPDSRLVDLAGEFRSRRIPADALWLDIQHMDGFRTFTWHPTDFPDPAGLISALGDQGFQVTVIADPGIKLDPGWSVYDSGLGAGVYLRDPGGDPYVGEVWPGPSVFPDFSLPGARTWWGDQVGTLVSAGVRGVWLDVNEPTNFPESGGGNTVPNDLVIDGDGRPGTMAEGHNVYALGEARATYEGMLRAAPDRRPFILTRAAYAGIQRWAAAWTGDAPSTWASLAQTPAMLMNMGLSGEAFVGSDVGGYSGGASPELFARWMAVGAISPFFRGHVTSGVNDQEPWAFGQEVEDISRFHIGWRYKMLPYLYSLFDHAARTGAPVLRPLVYDYQDDPVTHTVGDQAMLGPWLLTAPVVSEGAQTRRFYLPAGRWFEYRSGAVYEGPQWIDLPVTLAALPRYVREGAILPHGPLMQHTGAAPLDPLELHVYPAEEETRFTLYEDAGDGFAQRDDDCFSRTTYRTQRLATGARIAAEAREGACPPQARTVELRLRRVDHPPTSVLLNGLAMPAQPDLDTLRGEGHGWVWDAADLGLVIRFADVDGWQIEADYDPSLTEERPVVEVPLVVHVPPGTPGGPGDPVIHIASSADDWTTHHPLSWGADPNTATGTVTVRRGEWFWFKYTRGDWNTVEKWPGCVEASNRYGFGAAHPARDDTVYEWADLCLTVSATAETFPRR